MIMKDVCKKSVSRGYFRKTSLKYPCTVLSAKQRAFAGKNHRLVYKFLYENGLPADEYYDVVIFGYLRAVRRYLTDARLRRYRFSTIAWSCMRADLMNYVKTCERNKCTVSLRDNFTVQQTAWQHMEMGLLIHDLKSRVTKNQMEVILLRIYGYSVSEIAEIKGSTAKRIRKILRDTYTVLRQICDER